jgi:ParB family chromosome partitioning protein
MTTQGPVRGGHIELERRIDSILIGVRHRKDAGDIAELADSIDRLGLLQPITISPDGVLVCGWRRLLAIQRLGWTTTRVWVRSGISDRLSGLLAQQDENTLHKPFSQLEAAALYRELKQVMAEDAAHRQAATRFGSTPAAPIGPAPRAGDGGEGGPGADSAPPAPVGTGADSAPPPRPGSPDARKTRRQAAQLVTGTASYSRLEQIGALQEIAADPNQAAAVREMTARELEAIENGAPVDPAYQRVQAALQVAAHATHDSSTGTAPIGDAEDLHRRAAEAVARAKDRPRGRRRSKRTGGAAGSESHRPSVRSFALTWADLDGWVAGYDPTEVGTGVSQSEWECFERVLGEVNEFATAARAARASSSPAPPEPEAEAEAEATCLAHRAHWPAAAGAHLVGSPWPSTEGSPRSCPWSPPVVDAESSQF